MISQEDRSRVITSVELAAPARALNLISRITKRFEKRGWPIDDRLYIAIGAVSLYKLGVTGKNFRIAPGPDDPKCWAAIVGSSTPEQIVESLELRDMLEPEVISSLVR